MPAMLLCIDARAAEQFALGGLVAQEVVDQLVAAKGDSDSTPWINRSRTVLVAHPRQIFTGQLKRFNTRRRIGRSPFYWLWERGLTQRSEMTAFHRFRPIDRIAPGLRCPTVTTVLPAHRAIPWFLPKGAGHHFVVPSQRDGERLTERYGVHPSRVALVRPGVRRYVHFSKPPQTGADGGWILVVGSAGTEPGRLNRTLEILSRRFPNLPVRTVKTSRREDVIPDAWLKLAANAKLVLYATEAPFDWGCLALESIFWGVPTLFSDHNGALAECLPASPLSLARFLIDQPDLASLKIKTAEAKAKLSADGIFDPLAAARQYREVYERFPETARAAAGPAPSEGCCGDH